MREVDGKTVPVHDPDHKRRKDYIDRGCGADQADPAPRHPPHQAGDREGPSASRPTRMERYIVSCYAAEDGGHFRAAPGQHHQGHGASPLRRLDQPQRRLRGRRGRLSRIRPARATRRRPAAPWCSPARSCTRSSKVTSGPALRLPALPLRRGGGEDPRGQQPVPERERERLSGLTGASRTRPAGSGSAQACPLRSGTRLAEPGGAAHLPATSSQHRGHPHDRLHRGLGAYALRQAGHRNRREPDRARRRTRRWRMPGIGAEDVDEIVLGHFNAGFSPQDFTASLVFQASDRLPLQARDAGRERLRDRLGRRSPGAQEHRGQARQDRAGGRRRADDHDARARDRQEPAQGLLSAGGRRDAGRLRGRVRPDRRPLFPAPWRPVRRARHDRREEPQERRRQSLCADAQGSRLRVLPRTRARRTPSWPAR